MVPGSGVTPKWVLTLLTGLCPTTSRFFAEQRGGQQFRGWGPGMYATAATLDAIRALTWVYIAAHVKSKPKMPDSYPLPQAKTTQAAKPGSFAFIATAGLTALKRRKALGL